jgi:hypothetical protein
VEYNPSSAADESLAMELLRETIEHFREVAKLERAPGKAATGGKIAYAVLAPLVVMPPHGQQGQQGPGPGQGKGGEE